VHRRPVVIRSARFLDFVVVTFPSNPWKSSIFPSLVTVLFAILAQSGCVGLTSAKSGKNSSSAGSLATSQTSFSFENVEVGFTSSQSLTLANSGTAVVTISGTHPTRPSFSVASSASNSPSLVTLSGTGVQPIAH
jgi:hypothetical protein